ncbi:MAG TPA: hypothetical protein VGI83_08060 [Gemmatimonadales bacterium]
MAEQRLPPGAERFKRRLLAWYRTQARDLPWRRTRDAYRVVVSEFMLQQTQVSRVEQFYPKFIARYPTIADLAKARPKAVRESWDGLGYYRRAANLHQLAKDVIANHQGELPKDPETLRKLPGIGAYTAGAVAAFAYERREPAVDTNVDRVLRRVFFGTKLEGRRASGHEGKRGGKRRTAKPPPSGPRALVPPPADVWSLARAILPRRGKVVWEFNQALMDLGATVCTARIARCEICPVKPVCKTGKNRAVNPGTRTPGR